MTTDDYSGNIYRFNCFTFSEGLAISATAGGFDLDGGTYDYQVWETEYQYSLDVASASNIVEIGLMQIVGTLSSDDVTYTEDDGDTEYVFE
jgi:hypothetical protein